MRVLLKKNQMIKCLEMRQTAVSLTVEDSDRQKHRQTEKMNERGERGRATSLAAIPGRLGANHKNKTKETTRATVSQCHVDSTHFDTALLLQLGTPWVLLVGAVSTES